MGLVTWLVFGLLAGWLASLLSGNRGRQGCLGNIVIGVVGAWIGGFLGNRLFNHAITGFNLDSMVLAVAGAIILLFFLNLIRGSR